MSFSQTTIQDYNYLKKGYWIAKSMGYELRKDVDVYKSIEWDNEEAKLTVYFLAASKESEPKCYMIFIENKTKNKKSSITVPIKTIEPTLWDEFQKEVRELENTERYYVILSMYKLKF